MLPFDISTLIQVAGYPGIFAIIFAESGLIIGFFLPGASLLFTSGFLSSQGILDIRILVPLVAIAAIAGDNVGYWFGAKVGIHLFDRPDSRFFKREYLERTRRFYQTYGTRTVLFARFIPVVRTFAPILAGVAGMNYRTFMIFNVMGGIIWAGGIAAAGYALGSALPGVSEYIEFIILGIIFATTLPLFLELLRSRRSIGSARGVIFDLDGTLAAPFEVASLDMIRRLEALLRRIPVAIVSGATFERIESSVVTHIDRALWARLTILPQNGAQAWNYDRVWRTEFDESIDATERATIHAAIQATLTTNAEFAAITPQGETIVDRSAYVAFTALGTDAPRHEKDRWDSTAEKRRGFIRELQLRLPGYDIYIGGKTTIDIMRKGVNKAFGVRWLLARWKIPAQEIVFFGDALYRGGNDFPVIATGVRTVQVEHPENTARHIDKLLEKFESEKSRT